jgi:hypothetical protein
MSEGLDIATIWCAIRPCSLWFANLRQDVAQIDRPKFFSALIHPGARRPTAHECVFRERSD